MELSTSNREDPSAVVETVEVASGGGNSERVLSPGGTESTLKILNNAAANLSSISSSGIIEIDPQALSLVQMSGSNFDVSTVTPLSLAATQVTSQAILSDIQQMKNSKRPLQDVLPDLGTPEVPRKKSRNYLDSHKSIEKKRRDRINNGLATLKEIVPNCRQYVSQGNNKKLDKAEILEMAIDYIHRLQAQNQANGRGNVDLETSQRDWINDLMSWIFHNKLLYSGVEQFANALLLHLQSLGSTHSTAAPATTSAGLMYNQYPEGTGSASEDEGGLTHHTNNNTLLEQLTTAATNTAVTPSNDNNNNDGNTSDDIEKNTAVSQIEGGGEGGGASVVNSQQQSQQLAQLQALLLLQQQQMYQNQQQEGTNNVDTQQIQQLQQLHQLQTLLLQHLTNEKQAPPMQEVGGEVTVTPTQSVMVTTSAMESGGGALELTSGLDTTTFASEETLTDNSRGSQMWSQATTSEHTQHGVSSLLIEGGGVQEEVELLEQDEH